MNAFIEDMLCQAFVSAPIQYLRPTAMGQAPHNRRVSTQETAGLWALSLLLPELKVVRSG